MTGLPISELVAAAVAGEHSAFAEIYDRYADLVHGVCLDRLGDPAAAAAATGNVFFLAVHRLAGLRDRELLEPWLLAVTDRQLAGLATPGSNTLPTASPAPAQLREEALQAFAAWTSAGGAGQVARIGSWRRDGFPRRPLARRTVVSGVAAAAVVLVAVVSVAAVALSGSSDDSAAATTPASGTATGDDAGRRVVRGSDGAANGTPAALDPVAATPSVTSNPSTTGPTTVPTTGPTTSPSTGQATDVSSATPPTASGGSSTAVTSVAADPGQLLASPAAVAIAAASGASAEFTLSHTGTGAAGFTVSAPAGLTAAPSGGTLRPGVPVTVVLTRDPGVAPAAGLIVTVTSPTAGSTQVSVGLPRDAALSVTELSNPLGIPEPTTATFELRNTGTAAAAWTATASQPWLGVTPAAGSLAPGEMVVITVSIAPDPNPVPAKTERVVVKAPGSPAAVVKVPLTAG